MASKSDASARGAAPQLGSGVLWIGLVVFALAFPFLAGFDRYLLHVGITIALNVSLATSLWLIWSLGLVSFAHAGFMGIGAYTSAILLTKLGWPMWLGMWVGGAFAGAIALMISLPLMRTRAVYFFMASWSVGEVIKRIFAYYRDFFGGWNGMFDINPPVLSLGSLTIDFARSSKTSSAASGGGPSHSTCALSNGLGGL